MIYDSTYFDNCNGVIPQIVLSSCLLQAGNERAALYKNQLTTDNSQTTTFSFDGDFLTINGVLPLAESSYLITKPSLISRIGAINSENASMFSDILGLPVAGFDPRPGLTPVVVPLIATNLSNGILVLEKRLAYLLLLQQKRNYLIQLYNYLNYTRLASELVRTRNIATPIIGEVVPATATTTGGTATFTGAVIGTVGWDYTYEIDPIVRVGSIIGTCLSNLYTTYPDLYRLLPTISGLSDLSDWVVAEMQKPDPILLPPIDFNLLVDNIADTINEARQQPAPREPLGVVMNDNQSDVSSTISGLVSNGNNNVETPSNTFSETTNDARALSEPSSSNTSPLTPDRPNNSLPPC
ncbi:hypothetical protein [Chamaesiphon sp.]|uniref:hypothetical protein n=1 Tax=Chamaesiphon sp. TaxID=2814140 RepID=UPI0035939D68